MSGVFCLIYTPEILDLYLIMADSSRKYKEKSKVWNSPQHEKNELHVHIMFPQKKSYPRKIYQLVQESSFPTVAALTFRKCICSAYQPDRYKHLKSTVYHNFRSCANILSRSIETYLHLSFFQQTLCTPSAAHYLWKFLFMSLLIHLSP